MTAKAATTHYTAAEVSNATWVSVPKQNQWGDRRITIPARTDKRPTGHGSYRLVCAATVYNIAIIEAGTRQGLPARRAADAARLFAVQQPGRNANALYEHGLTLLIVKAGDAEIVNAPFESSLTDICGRPFESATILNLSQIIKAVDEKLYSIKNKGITK
jgi:hypothetical protein